MKRGPGKDLENTALCHLTLLLVMDLVNGYFKISVQL